MGEDRYRVGMDYAEGSMWAAFSAGFTAGQMPQAVGDAGEAWAAAARAYGASITEFGGAERDLRRWEAWDATVAALNAYRVALLGSPAPTVNTVPMSQILGQPKEEPKWVGFRPAKRPDGWPTRNAVEWWSDGERAIAEAMRVIEHIPGGSRALTDAVTLLASARGRVADHVEGCAANGKPAVPVDAIAATLAHDVKPEKLVCNVVSSNIDRVGCTSCGNTWDAKLGVTGCVQGGHGGFAEPRDQAPSSKEMRLMALNERLKSESKDADMIISAARRVGADNWLAKDCAEALEGELLLRMDVLKDNERLNSENARVAGELAETTHELEVSRREHEKAIQRGADQWRAKDLAQARAGRLWKAMKEITEVTGPGSYLRGLADKALREDATRISGVVEPAPGPGRDECDGLPETAMRGQDERPKPWQIKDPLSEDGVECWAACGCPALEHNPGFCPLANHLETVGDAKEFGECSPQTMMYTAPASVLTWGSCGCPVTKHPMDECNEPPKFVMAANKPEKLLNCPGCRRNDGEHDPDCIVANPQGSRIRVVNKPTDPPPPRMVQIAVVPENEKMVANLVALDDRGRLWTLPLMRRNWDQTQTHDWLLVPLPERFEP